MAHSRPHMASTALQERDGGVLAARAGDVARVCSVPTHSPKTGTHQDGTSHRIEEERQGEYPILLIWEPNFSNHNSTAQMKWEPSRYC